MSVSVQNLDIRPRVCTALTKANIHTVKKLFSFSKLELCKKTGLGSADINEVILTAAKATFDPTPKRLIDVLKKTGTTNSLQHFKLSTGCPSIDKFLNGGLLYPGVTEICGESGSGKTQFCMQLCLNVERKNSLYICTEDVFPHKRLQQMASCFYQKNKDDMNLANVSEITDNIFIEHAADLDALWGILDVQLPVMLSSKSIKLIVIDSIAALFRVEFNVSQMAERAKVLAKMGSFLHKYTHQFQICIVCVNQVMDVFNQSSVNSHSLQKVMPALGLTWSYHVNTRILLSRTHYTVSMFQADQKLKLDPIVRCLSILFSSHLPCSKCYYIVDEVGVKGIEIPSLQTNA